MMVSYAKHTASMLLFSVFAMLCGYDSAVSANIDTRLFSDGGNTDSASARIAIDKKEINVGAVRKDSLDRVYTVVVRNSGGAPLKIKDVGTSCFCTLVDYPKGKILPGDSAVMSITLQTREMAYAQIFIREIYVETNDPQTLCDTIVVTGSVVR